MRSFLSRFLAVVTNGHTGVTFLVVHKSHNGDAQSPVTARPRHVTSHHEIRHICDI